METEDKRALPQPTKGLITLFVTITMLLCVLPMNVFAVSGKTEIAGTVSKRDNMDDYDTIFVGFPIWWYVAPTIINTFLESYDLTRKTIIPFATSGGSGMGKTNEKLMTIAVILLNPRRQSLPA